jgi:hypothetical protein
LKRLIHIIMNSFIFFLQNFYLAAQMPERVTREQRIYKKIEYLMVSSWKVILETYSELSTWTTWKFEKEWEGFKFGTQSREYLWVVLANRIK